MEREIVLQVEYNSAGPVLAFGRGDKWSGIQHVRYDASPVPLEGFDNANKGAQNILHVEGRLISAGQWPEGVTPLP